MSFPLCFGGNQRVALAKRLRSASRGDSATMFPHEREVCFLENARMVSHPGIFSSQRHVLSYGSI